MFNRVADFHRTFNQLVAISPQLPNVSIRNLRKSLLLEELNEFCEAFKVQDIVEMCDALADMCYIIAGTCVSYGICPVGEKFESPYDQEGWVHKQVKIFYNLKLDRVLQEDFRSYEMAEEHDDLEYVRTCLMTMITDIYGIGFHLGIPLNAIFEEVHRSNMAKAQPDGTVRYREDGKVLKGKNYFPPNIKAILESHGMTIPPIPLK